MHETNLYTVTIPPMIKALESLSSLLDKAERHSEMKKADVGHLIGTKECTPKTL